MVASFTADDAVPSLCLSAASVSASYTPVVGKPSCCCSAAIDAVRASDACPSIQARVEPERGEPCWILVVCTAAAVASSAACAACSAVMSKSTVLLTTKFPWPGGRS